MATVDGLDPAVKTNSMAPSTVNWAIADPAQLSATPYAPSPYTVEPLPNTVEPLPRNGYNGGFQPEELPKQGPRGSLTGSKEAYRSLVAGNNGIDGNGYYTGNGSNGNGVNGYYVGGNGINGNSYGPGANSGLYGSYNGSYTGNGAGPYQTNGGSYTGSAYGNGNGNSHP